MSFCWTFLTALSAIGCSPDAGQRDPPGPLAKHDEAQLLEFCLEFLHLAIRSLTNMACRSSGMFLDKPTKIHSDPVSHINQPLLFRQHFCLGIALLQKLLMYIRLCGCQSSHLSCFTFRTYACIFCVVVQAHIVQLRNIVGI